MQYVPELFRPIGICRRPVERRQIGAAARVDSFEPFFSVGEAVVSMHIGTLIVPPIHWPLSSALSPRTTPPVVAAAAHLGVQPAQMLTPSCSCHFAPEEPPSPKPPKTRRRQIETRLRVFRLVGGRLERRRRGEGEEEEHGGVALARPAWTGAAVRADGAPFAETARSALPNRGSTPPFDHWNETACRRKSHVDVPPPLPRRHRLKTKDGPQPARPPRPTATPPPPSRRRAHRSRRPRRRRRPTSRCCDAIRQSERRPLSSASSTRSPRRATRRSASVAERVSRG